MNRNVELLISIAAAVLLCGKPALAQAEEAATEEQVTEDVSAGAFTMQEIRRGDEIFQRIDGKSWQENPDIELDRSTGREHMITEEDPAYKLFTEHGFTWGGSWSNPRDYQHFEYKID